MRWLAVLVLAFCSACGAARQPESSRTVAAYEVPLPSPQQKAEFLALLQRAAKAEGLHVDASDAAELKRMSEVSPITIHAAVWRGKDDDESVASVMDLPGNLGMAWITFDLGEDRALTARFRERAIRSIRERWPDTRALPIIPPGTIPLPRDLRATPGGYRVKRSAASRYGLAPTSPLLARD